MAQPLNTEFNYRYQVLGSTPWERIKTLKGFLNGRLRAAALEQVADLKLRGKHAELQYLRDTNAPLHEQLYLEAEIIEIESVQEDQAHAFALNKREIEVIQNILAELYDEVEPTRLPGYTDDQMFELNAGIDFAVTVLREIQSEIIANGRPSPAKLLNAMSCPHGLDGLKKLGILPTETQLIDYTTIEDKLYAPICPTSSQLLQCNDDLPKLDSHRAGS